MDAAPEATPHSDGVENLLKYAFGIVATGNTTPFTTEIAGKGIFYVVLTDQPDE